MPKFKKLKSSHGVSGGAGVSTGKSKKVSGAKSEVKSEAKKVPGVVLPAAIVLAGILVAASIIGKAYLRGDKVSDSDEGGAGSQKVQATRPSNESEVAGVETISLIPDGTDPVLGEPDAPVLMIEFSEFPCPFCERYSLETFPKIKEEYIDTGKIRYVFKDFLVHGESAAQVGLVAQCAFEQDAFWEMHDLLFERRDDWLQAEEAEKAELFQSYADELELDLEELEVCIEAGSDDLESDTAEGQGVGIQGTPSFLIGGELLVGAQPYEKFQEVIEKALGN